MPAVDVFDTDVADVRALIPDVEAIINPNRPGSEPETIFTDSHLASLLRLNRANVRLAAADALEVLGTSEALILKVVTTEDLATNGAALMGRYLERARQMRQAAAAEMNAEDEGGFDIIPFFVSPAHWEPR